MRWFILAAVLVTFSGCGSKNVVTEGDRKLSNQNKGAAKVIVESVDKAEAVPGVPAAALDALGPVKPAAGDIQANSEQQLKNWGPPEKPEPYSAAASSSSRKQSEEEHESSPIWPYVISAGTLALGVLLRSTGLGAIPFLGPILSRMSPRLAHGAGKADLLNVGLQEVLTESRSEIDKWGPQLRALLAEKGIPESILDKIPTGRQPLKRSCLLRGPSFCRTGAPAISDCLFRF
jgi:hypothetical protein